VTTASALPHVIVFLGPSLPLGPAREILDADYRPPAGQGDLVRACAEAPAAIALIDGVFKDAPTVRHREILWALAHDVPVFGAASMGALRAAELASFGMIGVGLIYRWYRRFALLPDDAVGVTHMPAALGSQPVSDALVDIRRTLRAAERAGTLSAAAARALAEAQTGLPFPERRVPPAAKAHAVSQKSRDARALLTRLATHQATGQWPTPPHPEVPIVHAWLDDLRDSGLSLADGTPTRPPFAG